MSEPNEDRYVRHKIEIMRVLDGVTGSIEEEWLDVPLALLVWRLRPCGGGCGNERIYRFEDAIPGELAFPDGSPFLPCSDHLFRVRITNLETGKVILDEIKERL